MGISGGLIGLGMPEYEAKRHEGHLTKGGSLLSVHCSSSYWVKQAKAVMKETGAEDISSSGETSIEHTQNARRPAAESRVDEQRIESSLGVTDAANEIPSIEEIRNRAYRIYLMQGTARGHEVEDWFMAERELKEEYRQYPEHERPGARYEPQRQN